MDNLIKQTDSQTINDFYNMLTYLKQSSISPLRVTVIPGDFR